MHQAKSRSSDNTEKIYINGKLGGETVDTQVVNGGLNNSCGEGAIYIVGSNTYKIGMNGWIDDFQVWDRVLSDNEVAAAMNCYP